MEIHNLNSLGTPSGDSCFVADSGTDTGKVTFSEMCQALMEDYSGSSLGGSVRTPKQAMDAAEQTANRVTSISSSSTNDQYPTAKAVYDYIQALDADETSY